MVSRQVSAECESSQTMSEFDLMQLVSFVQQRSKNRRENWFISDNYNICSQRLTSDGHMSTSVSRMRVWGRRSPDLSQWVNTYQYSSTVNMNWVNVIQVITSREKMRFDVFVDGRYSFSLVLETLKNALSGYFLISCWCDGVPDLHDINLTYSRLDELKQLIMI